MLAHQLFAFSDDGLKKIQERMESLRVDLGASAALMLDESGQLLAECGRLRGFDRNAFLALVGNAMSASNAVVHLLHDDAAFDLHYHEGQNYEMYTTRLSDRIFLTIMLERSLGATSRIGMVWLTLRRAVTDLRALVKQSMVEPDTTASREIKSAVSDTLDEALSLIDGDWLAPTSAPIAPAPPPVEDAPRPRKKLPGRDQLPAEDAPRPRKKLPGRDRSPAQPAEPSAPGLSPDILNDPNHVLTYEEARALGLINLDEPEVTP